MTQKIIYNNKDGKKEKVIFIVDRRISRINEDAGKILASTPNKSIWLKEDLTLIDLDLDLKDSFKEKDDITLIIFYSKNKKEEIKKKIIQILEES